MEELKALDSVIEGLIVIVLIIVWGGMMGAFDWIRGD